MKISELIQDYRKISKVANSKTLQKVAFIPNPEVVQQQQQQAQAQQAQPQQQTQQQPQQQPQQQQQPGQEPPGAPVQATPPQMAQEGQTDTLMAQFMSQVQQLPPEAQQQLAPLVQKLQSLPPEQRDPQIQQILQQLSGAGAQQTQAAPQQGMEAQASGEEDLYAAMQGAQPQPEQPQGGGLPQPSPQEQAAQDAGDAESSAIQAKNELDNVKVTLTVRELLDLVGKGTATASLLKVKQLADTHQQKMDQ